MICESYLISYMYLFNNQFQIAITILFLNKNVETTDTYTV